MKVYHVQETLFDKVEAFEIPYTEEQNLFESMASFVSTSIYRKDEDLNHTDKTIWIINYVPSSVFTSFNLLEDPILLSKVTPLGLVSSFIDSLEKLATETEAPTETKFPTLETTVWGKFAQFCKIPNQHIML